MAKLYICRSDSSKWLVRAKCVGKAFARNKFLVSECILKLVFVFESCRGCAFLLVEAIPSSGSHYMV